MNNTEHQALVIGAAGLDMQVRAQSLAIEVGQSNPGHIRWGWGGVARNIAENLARLGADVQFLTVLGDDESGRQLLAHLHSVGVHTEASIIALGQETGASVELYHLDERLWIAFDDMRLTRKITPGYLNRQRRMFRDAEVICIDANLSAPALQTIFRLAGKYEVPVCADPTTALLAPRLHPYLNEIAVLTPNRLEAEALLGEQLPDEEAILQGARHLAQMGVGLAVITLGAEGLLYATSEESGRLPAFQADVVDPAGAGEALAAAVVYGLVEDFPPLEAVRLGLAAAAQTLICKETVCPTLSLERLYDRLVV